MITKRLVVLTLGLIFIEILLIITVPKLTQDFIGTPRTLLSLTPLFFIISGGVIIYLGYSFDNEKSPKIIGGEQ